MVNPFEQVDLSPHFESELAYEPGTERGWATQHSSAEAAGQAIGDFDTQFAALHHQLEGKVQAGRITPPQRDAILEQMSAKLGTYVPEQQTGNAIAAGQALSESRLAKLGELLGQGAKGVLQTPGLAVKHLVTPLLKELGPAFSEVSSITSTMLEGLIDQAAYFVQQVGSAVGEATAHSTGKLVEHAGEGSGKAIAAILKGTGKGVGAFPAAVLRGFQAVLRAS